MSKEKYIYVLPYGTVIQSQNHSYQIVGVLGQGGFGITYKVVNEYNQILALKEHFVKNRCFRGENGTDMAFFDSASNEVIGSMKEFKREGELLVNISYQSPNIVKVFEVFEANNTTYYSMEYLAGGSLRDLIRAKGPQKEEMARMLMEPIAMALTYLHGKRYLHMDIKPDNIVMRVNPGSNMMTPVLIDFGVSLHFDDKDDLTTTHHIAGVTKGFSPIEQYEPVNRFAPTVDIYSLAATWFYLLAGRNPLAASDITPEWIQQNLPNHVGYNTRNAIIEGMRFRAYERPKNIKAFLRLLDGSVSAPPPQGSPLLSSQRSPLLKRLIIAACALAAVAGIVIFSLNNCGGGEIKNTGTNGKPGGDSTIIEPDTVSLPQEKETFPRYYEMIDSIRNDTLYICIDSINNRVEALGCFRGSKSNYFWISGHLYFHTNLDIDMWTKDWQVTVAGYQGVLSDSLYDANRKTRERTKHLFKIVKIDKILFYEKYKLPTKIDPSIETKEQSVDSIIKNGKTDPDSTIKASPTPPVLPSAPEPEPLPQKEE